MCYNIANMIVLDVTHQIHKVFENCIYELEHSFLFQLAFEVDFDANLNLTILS